MKIDFKENPVTFSKIKIGECFNFIYENGASEPFIKIRVDNRVSSVDLSNGCVFNVASDTEVNPLNLMVTLA